MFARQPCLGECLSCRVCCRMSGDRRKEVVASQGKQLRVDRCGDGSCSRHVPKQRDLAEVVGLRCGRMNAVRVDLELTVADDVEAISYLTSADDKLARGDRDRDEVCRQPL